MPFPFEHLKKLDVSCPEVSQQKVIKPTYWIYGSGGEAQWLHVIKEFQIDKSISNYL